MTRNELIIELLKHYDNDDVLISFKGETYDIKNVGEVFLNNSSKGIAESVIVLEV